jgi:hypothetical protein
MKVVIVHRRGAESAEVRVERKKNKNKKILHIADKLWSLDVSPRPLRLCGELWINMEADR